MLFPFITQRIADYLNMDGNLEQRKGAFCILNLTASGGLMGIFLIIVLWMVGMLSPFALWVEMMFVIVGCTAQSLFSFRKVEPKKLKGDKPGRSFVFACFLPMFVYLLLTLLLMFFY
ncbi:MAG: hypothetical protein LIP11_01415 [Clostridiales bacterium]|nr:hypothetical protein [Clostridiales bacterium]